MEGVREQTRIPANVGSCTPYIRGSRCPVVHTDCRLQVGAHSCTCLSGWREIALGAKPIDSCSARNRRLGLGGRESFLRAAHPCPVGSNRNCQSNAHRRQYHAHRILPSPSSSDWCNDSSCCSTNGRWKRVSHPNSDRVVVSASRGV